MTRERIYERVKKALRQQAENRCPLCGEDDEFTFQYHHIKPVSEGGESKEPNLILLCSNCHSRATHGQIEKSEIEKVKQSLGNRNHSHTTPKTESDIINFQGRNKGQVANKIENKIEIKTENKTVKLNPPSGAIASSLAHKNYTKYLIDRYHEFKKSEIGQKSMKYAVLYKSITRKFGAKWDMIPLGRFDELAVYLQDRIDNTILGKTHKANSRRNYSTFEEYCDKYCKQVECDD